MERLLYVLIAVSSCTLSAASDDLLVNGDFENGMQGWTKAWSRMPGVKAVLDEQVRHSGKDAVRIEHSNPQDWSLSQEKRLNVKPGEIYELSGWLRTQGEGDVALSVTLYDAKKQAIDWSFGGRDAHGTAGWQQVRSRFVIPPDGGAILARLTGHGTLTAWADDLALRRVGQIDLQKAAKLPAAITKGNRGSQVTFHPADGTITLRDLRCGQVWSQRPEKRCYVLDAKATGRGIEAILLDPASVSEVGVTLQLDGEKPELVVELAGKGPMSRISYPHPIVSPAKSWLIMPVNEGIGYPVDDQSLRPMHYYLYGGHGLCMAWYGVTDLDRGLMTLVETPDDAAVNVPRANAVCNWPPSGSRSAASSGIHAGYAMWPSIMAGTWRWPSGIASTPKPWACSRPWRRNARKTRTLTCWSARSTCGPSAWMA